MKRKIILDTETTGLRPDDGHRIVEIGAVEVIDNKKTGRTYQVYLNPEREISQEAFDVHGLSYDFLKTKPKFADIVDDFLGFIQDAELVIHNADFDIKFLNSELERVNKDKVWTYIKNATCSLRLDRRLFAEEKKHTLDAMCLRFGIDTSTRSLHGALLDSDLLADCFIRTNEIYSAEEIEADLEQSNWVRPEIKRFHLPLLKTTLTSKEEQEHLLFLNKMEEKEKIKPQFLQPSKKVVSP